MRALLFVFLVGCASHDKDADAIPCRNDCSRTTVTCSNACNDDASPGLCKTACAANELSCQKVCEAQFPGEDSIRCRGDCDRFSSTCNNGCGTDNNCRAACANKVQTCKLECYGIYGDGS